MIPRTFILTYPDDDQPMLGNARVVARHIQGVAQSGETTPLVWYLEADGHIRQAKVETETSPFDTGDWATTTVKIMSADGEVLGESSYSVDGRA